MQGGLIALDQRDVVGVLVLDEEARVGGLRVEGVEGDHRAVQVERGKQGLEDGDLVGRGDHLALGGDQAGPRHRGEQMDLGAVGAAGTAHGLAVHGEGGQGPPVAVVLLLAGGAFAPGEPTSDGCIQRVAVDALEDTTHGGLGRGDGATGPGSGSRHGPPSRARTLGGASAAHSAIAARDFAPARTAHAARERTKASGWRRPWSRRGSGT